MTVKTGLTLWRRLALIVLFQGSLLAAPLPLDDVTDVVYAFQGERLTAVLTRFFADQGVRLNMSDALERDRRTLNGRRSGSPRDIFTSLAESNGLLTYYDKQAAYVYLASEVEHDYLPLNPKYAPRIERALAQMGMMDSNNHTRLYTDAGLAEIHGVPRYVEHARQVINTITDTASQEDNLVIQYFPLKYAWATDRTFNAGESAVTVPGVATLLRNILNGQPTDNYAFGSQAARQTADTARRVTGPEEEDQPLSAESFDTPNRRTGNGPDTYRGEGAASVVADPYRNAVIVRDTPENLAMYNRLIEQLDVPTQIVEIEATIIDVNTDRLRSLGTEWRFEDTENNVDVSSGSSGDIKSDFISALQADSTSVLQQVPGLQIGAIVGDEQRFVTRLRALENEGVLKVSSRPKVATLNDLEAVIEASRSLFVPVEGAYEVDLFEVFAGTVFRVTPHVIEDDDQNRIRLTIAVRDGVVDVNGDMPVSTRNSVNTQAIINEGASLLLGGLEREESVVNEHKIPLLGDIPILGYLFKTKSTSIKRSERLFLISPRLLTPDGTPGLAGYGTVDPWTSSIRSPQLSSSDSGSCPGNCDYEHGDDSSQQY
ncbi:type III secretion system outer membrane ring subunit SctC [Saccharospirillum salsuginis]|uniref:Type 3 secretion system secretin n=1 Tax=Saccharospirillum salsuginis TaxID=418750 RepID=A0A918KTE2_9GAMM|nr:type III secretion system outer membrane ring subunit SctC [Saccharospirillum salsuginis]GGX75359.1 EscC/YscC/HrcC family type III secretion system outer membrane ring protein [Saccharospirillum salsuginis]